MTDAATNLAPPPPTSRSGLSGTAKRLLRILHAAPCPIRTRVASVLCAHDTYREVDHNDIRAVRAFCARHARVLTEMSRAGLVDRVTVETEAGPTHPWLLTPAGREAALQMAPWAMHEQAWADAMAVRL